MTLGELLQRDQGSLILAPTVGLHENVGVLDFESMFPHLILRDNISYETAGHRGAGEGFILGFTRDALSRRLYFKHLRRSLPRGSREWVWCEERQLALKEMLVVIYGYSGCFANRFGSLAAYMEINRAARDSLVESMNVARGAGFRVLYGNSDSLFLHRPGATRGDYEGLASLISRRVGLPMAVDNVFRFLVLLPQKGDAGLGAVNRYYGRTVEGEYVSRGIELRRRGTPRYVADVQRRVIEALLSCETVEEACRRLRAGEVPTGDLVVSTALRRGPGSYGVSYPHVAAARALSMSGYGVVNGGLVEYVYVDAGHRNPYRRVKPPVFTGGRVDVEKYVKMVEAAAQTILSPVKEVAFDHICSCSACL